LPGCVLRLSGPRVALASALDGAFVTFEESRACQRGRRLGRTTEADESTFNFTVSHADGDHVPVQVREAETFLVSHAAELTVLRSRNGVTNGLLDFGWSIPSDGVGQFNRFPSSLLTLCSKLGLDIEVSIYLGESGDSDA